MPTLLSVILFGFRRKGMFGKQRQGMKRQEEFMWVKVATFVCEIIRLGWFVKSSDAEDQRAQHAMEASFTLDNVQRVGGVSKPCDGSSHSQRHPKYWVAAGWNSHRFEGRILSLSLEYHTRLCIHRG
jgi:hypothetical protein